MAQRIVRAKRKIVDASIPYARPARRGAPGPPGGRARRRLPRLQRGLPGGLGHRARPRRPRRRGDAARAAARRADARRRRDARAARADAAAPTRAAAPAPTRGRQLRAARRVRTARAGIAAQIDEGIATLDRALRLRRTGPYQVQAGDRRRARRRARAPRRPTGARSSASTRSTSASPRRRSSTLNQAVAVGFADGPSAGLALLEPLRRERRARRATSRSGPRSPNCARGRATRRARASPTSARSR